MKNWFRLTNNKNGTGVFSSELNTNKQKITLKQKRRYLETFAFNESYFSEDFTLVNRTISIEIHIKIFPQHKSKRNLWRNLAWKLFYWIHICLLFLLFYAYSFDFHSYSMFFTRFKTYSRIIALSLASVKLLNGLK